MVNRLIGFLEKLQLRQILTVFLAGILLFASSITLNNSQYSLEVSSNNAALQAGKLAYLDTDSQLLISSNKTDGLLYPGAETPAGRIAKEKELPIKTLESTNQAEAGGFNQRQADLGDRVEGRLDAAKETFKEASSFFKDKAEEASARPELQKNPALGR
ncbi:DUF6658 family protein [Rivularia sp. UHCC 0363]|uniref:DUF6658 family protein n=1 Tax=Rivularia sp. UHCC 0363 TaxID=3110244 RepID=UPI002B20C8E2|nr:DUF6658 family protein [Rivularia sp. UHCC 0363]MEA5598061.1 DUF6658 family protein [Rivularia sp. UHCC 0363]